jgi:hypothetical protein
LASAVGRWPAVTASPRCWLPRRRRPGATGRRRAALPPLLHNGILVIPFQAVLPLRFRGKATTRFGGTETDLRLPPVSVPLKLDKTDQ